MLLVMVKDLRKVATATEINQSESISVVSLWGTFGSEEKEVLLLSFIN